MRGKKWLALATIAGPRGQKSYGNLTKSQAGCVIACLTDGDRQGDEEILFPPKNTFKKRNEKFSPKRPYTIEQPFAPHVKKIILFHNNKAKGARKL